MRLVTAVVRSASVEKIAAELVSRGITGMTFYEVKGIGEQAGINKPYTIHYKIETIVPDDRVKDVEDVFLKYAHTGQAGDGYVAAGPIDAMIRIRTKEQQR